MYDNEKDTITVMSMVSFYERVFKKVPTTQVIKVENIESIRVFLLTHLMR